MCLAYNKLYGMKNVCLRYFNVSTGRTSASTPTAT